MFFTVYSLKRNGVRLSKQDALATARIGQLIYRLKRPLGPPVQEAVLLDERGIEQETLYTAELRMMDANGILLRGYVTDYSQTAQRSAEVWWCVYRPDGPLMPCMGAKAEIEHMLADDPKAPKD